MPERLIDVIQIRFAVLMIIAWAARLAFRSELTTGLIVRQLTMSVLVGFIAAQYAADSSFPDWQANAVFCACVFLADDILAMLLAFGAYAKDNQQTIFNKITSFLSGKK